MLFYFVVEHLIKIK